ncbi:MULTISPECIES: SMI1/KNR4 family protein [Myroides]|uniref:SMI1/KNR4 family protein n=1 Tax=Myroides TaxID=76831 RepID=UPI00132A7ABC|nr:MULTISPECIES: SMI1/KNR4 family protein [Myroides]MVX34479.1 hypothetical protein [Myroides sp. LoEW2-1]UVD80496.1 SMI1/KNR4 family protein [Myroides albus]
MIRNKIILKDSFPALSKEQINTFEKRLIDKFSFPPLPEDYKAFLLQNNGGYVSPGVIDEGHSHDIVFDTPLQWVRAEGKPKVRPNIYCFFAVWLPDEMNIDEVTNEDLYTLEASNAYSREDFDVLPTLMMSIGMTSHEASGDLLAISLEEEEYGAVYYSYNNATHPAKFHGDYYDKAAQVIIDTHKLTPEIYNNLEGEEKRKMEDLFKKAYFVKVANSFTEFLNNCEVIENPYQ